VPQLGSTRSRSRAGFTLIELLIVVIIAGVLLTISGGAIGRQIARDRVMRSATVVQGMLAEAGQTAVRRRSPVTVTLVGTALRINDRATGNMLRQENFGPAFDLRASLAVSPSGGITIFQNGRANAAISVTVSGSGLTQTVSRTATGIVRRQ
jgi:prepilin-type N-terminal cleavage/methylation domain-containing protein